MFPVVVFFFFFYLPAWNWGWPLHRIAQQAQPTKIQRVNHLSGQRSRERASVKQRMWEESSFWIFFSFTFPFSSYWPCPKCSFSHRAAMRQVCSHLKSPKPTFSTKRTRRGTPWTKERAKNLHYLFLTTSSWKQHKFGKTIHSTDYHSERNSIFLARKKGTPGQRA